MENGQRYGRFTVYTNKNEVYAVAKYNGKNVQAKAVCAEGDNFDINKGVELAIARCSEKISRKHLQRAKQELKENRKALDEALNKWNSSMEYLHNAKIDVKESTKVLNMILDEM